MTLETKMQSAAMKAFHVHAHSTEEPIMASDYARVAASACSTIAREHAIGFAEWMADSDKYARVADETGQLIWIDQDTPLDENGGDYYRITTAELYELYLKANK